jgi:omega-6 fatty acid desaturase (delta-12 desaturase)
VLNRPADVSAHYSANKWNFARGALCTIDRTLLGPIGGIVFHGICETHVSHHISSKIPHCKYCANVSSRADGLSDAAWEATTALKEFLGPYYMRSEENMLVSLFKNYRECRYVDDNDDVVFFKNSRGLAQRAVVDAKGAQSDSGVDVSEK